MGAKFDKNLRGSTISLVDFIWNDPNINVFSMQTYDLHITCLGLFPLCLLSLNVELYDIQIKIVLFSI